MFKVKVNFRSCFKDQGLLGGQVSRRELIRGQFSRSRLIGGHVFKVKVNFRSCFKD